ncbi:MAG: Gfo/Idh/MocA family oxidoreductase [Candidatus Protistobacter heckmanni]|nr:Gfo/Idh/MocA family oxidoreductase [Candidatus Protistobacter heckmanni]
MKVLIVGYGSIGALHAKVTESLGASVSVVSRRKIDFPAVYADLGQALDEQNPDYVVIANATSEHHGALSAFAGLGYTGTVLVEKPIFSRLEILPEHAFRDIVVAYNLRFHPITQRIKALLEGERILSVQAYVGQYLPHWRPATDYRKSYSASAGLGGGALRDLSHELDYLTWMLGGWNRVAAIGGQYSPLEIDSDDVFALLLATPRCPVVSVQLNYLDRLTRRFFLINTARYTIEADLIRNTLTVNEDVEVFSSERDQTYINMHMAVQAGEKNTLCSLEEGLDVLRLIDAAEDAAAHKTWMVRRGDSDQP